MTDRTIWYCGACGSTSLLPGLCTLCLQSHKYIAKVPRKVGPVQSLADVSVADLPRLPVIGFTGIENSLAGGFVRGSVILLHGGPGVGKSTLALQLCEAMGRYQADGSLYVSAEQMIAHVKMMAMRIQVDPRYVRVVETQELDDIVTAIEVGRVAFAVIDSLQEVHLGTSNYDGPEIVVVCQELVRLARETNCVLVLVCHETKDDSIAGPRRLEHLVDGMVNLEGWIDSEGVGGIRWHVHSKYRFGPVPKEVFLLRTLMGGMYERGTSPRRGGDTDARRGSGNPPEDAQGRDAGRGTGGHPGASGDAAGGAEAGTGEREGIA